MPSPEVSGERGEGGRHAESFPAVLLPLLGVAGRALGVVDLAQLRVRLLEEVQRGPFLVGQRCERSKVDGGNQFL